MPWEVNLIDNNTYVMKDFTGQEKLRDPKPAVRLVRDTGRYEDDESNFWYWVTRAKRENLSLCFYKLGPCVLDLS